MSDDMDTDEPTPGPSGEDGTAEVMLRKENFVDHLTAMGVHCGE